MSDKNCGNCHNFEKLGTTLGFCWAKNCNKLDWQRACKSYSKEPNFEDSKKIAIDLVDSIYDNFQLLDYQYCQAIGLFFCQLLAENKPVNWLKVSNEIKNL